MLVILLICLFYTPEHLATSGHSANLSAPTIGVQGLYTLAFRFPFLLPLLNLGNNVQLQRLSFSASKGSFVLVHSIATEISKIATEAPFPGTQSFKDSLLPVLSLLVVLKTLDSLIRSGSGLLNQWVRPALLLPLP